MKPSHLDLIDFPARSFMQDNIHNNKENFIQHVKIYDAIYKGRYYHRNSIFEQDHHKKTVYLHSALQSFTYVITLKDNLTNESLQEYLNFAYLQRSIIYRLLKEYDKSLSDLSNIKNADNTYHNLIVFERAVNYVDKAIDIFEIKNPNMFFTPITFTCDTSQIGYLSNALLYFSQLIKNNQFINHSRYNRALIYTLKNNYTDAINDFNYIINLQDRNFYSAIFGKAVCTYHLANSTKDGVARQILLESALTDFNRITLATFNHKDYLFFSKRLCYQGHILFKLDKVKEGLISYSRALELNPDLIQYLAKYKEVIFNSIKKLDNNFTASLYFQQCIDPSYLLGKIMWHPRGKSPCSLSTGILKECVSELKIRNKNIYNAESTLENESIQTNSTIARESANTKLIYDQISRTTYDSSRRSSSLKNFSELKAKSDVNCEDDFVLISKKSSFHNISLVHSKASETRTKIQKKHSTLGLFEKKKLAYHAIELSERNKENIPLQSINRNTTTLKRIL